MKFCFKIKLIGFIYPINIFSTHASPVINDDQSLKVLSVTAIMTCTLPNEKKFNQNEIYQLRLFPKRKDIFQLKYNYPSSFCNI